jgi:hypothetical protein
MVVPGQVRQEHVQHVFIDGDVVHTTIVRSTIDGLQFAPQSNRMTPWLFAA